MWWESVSTIDHTLTMIEIVKRNLYLKKPTFIVFVDMKKYFDQLWLEDGIIELWRAGMNKTDLRIILEMNKIAKARIDTTSGMTK